MTSGEIWNGSRKVEFASGDIPLRTKYLSLGNLCIIYLADRSVKMIQYPVKPSTFGHGSTLDKSAITP
jgi:hypothetical protein